MAELSAAARASVGKSHVAGAADIKVTAFLIGLAVVGAAFVLSWTAAGAESRPRYWAHKLTEAEAPSQDFRDHLADARELLSAAVFLPVVYPDRTAPGITQTMHGGFNRGSYTGIDPALRLPGGQTEAW